MDKKRLFWILMLILPALLPACGGTKIIDPWRDPAFPGGLKKVFVIGVVRTRGPRSMLEDEFARQLKARGIDAVASTSVLPDEPLPARDIIAAKVRESGADAVIAAKFIKKVSAETYSPSRLYAVPHNFDAEWDPTIAATQWTDSGLSEFAYDYYVAVMQTTVYSVGTGKPVWSAISETKYQGAIMHQVRPFVNAVMNRLIHEKLVP
ncbi:MAG: hypothetical protein HGB21_10905 [Nitrospirae bacterium]|nr:hypothetical protein [Nitrospirota bacterium]NTW66795.1 hypothetical protein [Nitrospirota bacterium]